jgi:uncharacterized UPF0146 family protein
MQRASIITRSGVDILYIDLSDLTGESFLSAIEADIAIPLLTQYHKVTIYPGTAI